MTEATIDERARFDDIRYAQVWEDADILVAALKPKPDHILVSIASAGDNALALLAEGCAQVFAVDLSAAQLACVRFRCAAYSVLTHNELLEVMGSRQSDRRGALLQRVASQLSDVDQAFWSVREDACVAHGVGGVGKFERYFRVFRERVLPLVHSRAVIDELLQPKSRAEREHFFDMHWNTWRWRRLLSCFFSQFVMGRLGRDPAFFDYAEGSLSNHVGVLTRHALVEQDPSGNPYLHWILRGSHGDHLPRALRAEHFDAIRDNLGRLELHQGPIETLAAEGVRADGFNLSDIFEYMGPQTHHNVYTSILQASAPRARLVYWNMMAAREAPIGLQSHIRRDHDTEANLKPADKAFFYRALVIEEAL